VRRKSRQNPEEGAGACDTFAALGDRTRLLLVSRLRGGGPLSIAVLTRDTGVTRQAVTKHLRVLEGAGLARSERRGRECTWQLERRRLDEARRYLDAISMQWDESLERLRSFVEA
jgi:DNA-binding transcriptional ArsR family regulator